MTKTGVVKALKLVHKIGSIAIECSPRNPFTFWSCSFVNFYPKNTLMTIITNSKRGTLLLLCYRRKVWSQVRRVQRTIIFWKKGSPEQILGSVSMALSLLKDQQLQIWYGQDWIGCSEDNNSGTACVDIFAWYVWDRQIGFTIRLKKKVLFFAWYF